MVAIHAEHIEEVAVEYLVIPVRLVSIQKVLLQKHAKIVDI
jgi:hypothetical protein